MKAVSVLVLISFITIHAPVAQAAPVPVTQLDDPRLVVETRQQLLQLGCQPVMVNRDQATLDIPSDKPNYLLPSDWVQDELFFCTEQVATGLTTKQAQVKGFWIPIIVAAVAVGALVAIFKSKVMEYVHATINWLLAVFINIGTLLLMLVSILFGLILGANKFITHPFVTFGWPIVQGVANLGFIFALLFIAAITTLRLEGFNIRRLLPRLLIAALLINFSLVISGVIIDTSRVLMAIMMESTSCLKLKDLGACILDQSDLIRYSVGVLEKSPDGKEGRYVIKYYASNDLQGSVNMVAVAILVWGLLVGMLMITVGLFIRYIMLILLLIFSPFAFLAFALPGADSLGKLWWSSFIKYVLYGPVALFILLLIMRVSGGANTFFGQNSSVPDPAYQQLMEGAIHVSLIVVLCFFAVKAGSSVSGFAAGAVVGYATGAGKRVGKLGAQGLYRGTGIRGRLLKVRDYGKGVAALPAFEGFRRRFGLGEFRTHDKEGRPIPGRISAGTAAARRLDPNVRAAKAAIARGDFGHESLRADKLIKPQVIGSLDREELQALFDNQDPAQMKIAVNSIEAARHMSDELRAGIITGSQAGAGQFSDKLLGTLNRIEMQDTKK